MSGNAKLFLDVALPGPGHCFGLVGLASLAEQPQW
jgi:hypothetical protein